MANNGRAKAEKLFNNTTMLNIEPYKALDWNKPPRCIFIPDKNFMRKIIKFELKKH